MKPNKNIFVVVPVYNDGKCIQQVIHELRQCGFPNIIIINDGSQENIKKLIQNLPVYYIQHKVNLGQGAALQTGFDFAKQKNADIVITFDADGQHDSKDLMSLIQPLIDEHYDITLGSRFLISQSIPFKRKQLLKLARLINFFFSGLLLTDAHNGLRAFNKKAIDKIRIEQNRMAHASEILFQIKTHQLTYKEVPSRIHYSIYSKKKGQKNSDSIAVFFDILLLKLFK